MEGIKMKKIVILVCILFFMTGCNVRYQVNINDDLSINESINIYGDSELYKTYNRTTQKNVLKEILELYEESLKEANYQYKINEEENPNILIEKKYSNIQSYIDNSMLFNDYFDKINYTQNGNIVKIETVGFNPNNEDIPERFYVNTADILVTLPYNVINHNAKSVNRKTNTYSYTFDDKTEDFSIVLEFDISKKFNPNIDIYITVLVTLLIIIISWILVYVFNKKKIF